MEKTATSARLPDVCSPGCQEVDSVPYEDLHHMFFVVINIASSDDKSLTALVAAIETFTFQRTVSNQPLMATGIVK